MKKILMMLIMGFIINHVQAQSLLGTLSKYQSQLPPDEAPVSPSVPRVPGESSKEIDIGKSNKICDSNNQNSLPLAYLKALLLSPNPTFKVNYDPQSKLLKFDGGKYIGNCSSMFTLGLRKSSTQPTFYAIEYKFNRMNCEGGRCKYPVRVKFEDSITTVDKIYEPGPAGLQQCLKDTGVLTDSGIQSDRIVKDTMEENFQGVEESGDVYFASEGPLGKQVDPAYGSVSSDGCLVYEKIASENPVVLSMADIESQRLAEEKSKVCDSNDYRLVADFIQKHKDYSDEMQEILNKLIEEEAIKVSKKLDEMIKDPKIELTTEDRKVMTDFRQLVVERKIKQMHDLFAEYATTPPEERGELEEKLGKMKAEVARLNARPFFSSEQVKMLIDKADFDTASTLNSMKLVLKHHMNLGGKEANNFVTPEVAMNRADADAEKFEDYLDERREEHEVKTGQTSGKADYYKQMANLRKRAIETRTRNLSQEIQYEYARFQQGGHCTAYFRNYRDCRARSEQRIMVLQQRLAHFNKVDQERGMEYEELAQKYEAWEAEGRRATASVYGDEVAQEEQEEVIDTTVAPPRQNTDGSYSFQMPQMDQQQQMWQQQQWQQQQQYSQQYPLYNQQYYSQYQQQPYYGQYQGQGSNWLNGAFNFNMGVGGGQYNNYGMYQPQQPIYNNYSAQNYQMYGGTQQMPWFSQGYNFR